MVTSQLDLYTLAQLSKTCRRGAEVVDSLPIRQQLVHHIPDVIATMGRTQTLRLHPAPALKAAMHTCQCVSCGEFGAGIFLLTAERCCLPCSRRVPSLWVLPREAASVCFGLSRRQAAALPHLRRVPGTFGRLGELTGQAAAEEFVSVRAAKEAGLRRHGSAAAMAAFLTLRHRQAPLDHKDLRYYRWLHAETAVEHRGGDPFFARFGLLPRMDDRFRGLATMRFPSVPPDGMPVPPERGVWCRGCRLNLRNFTSMALRYPAALHFLGDLWSQNLLLSVCAEREWTRDGFLEHITECEGGPAVERELLRQILRQAGTHL